MANYDYYSVRFKLMTEMLGTCTSASIWQKHIIEKAKKEIAKANKLSGKITKALEKYRGEDISTEKNISELKGIIRSYQQMLGKRDELPESIDELLEYAQEIEADFTEMCKEGDAEACTIFMKDDQGWPQISTHMILGNLKENLRIMVNNGDKSILNYKNSVGEVGALDLKPIESYMRPSHDIMRKADGAPDLLERPISFERMGKKQTAIQLSERLPIDTTFGCTLRVRRLSPLTETALHVLFDLGKNNGLGAWRGSGNRGAYWFKLEKLHDYEEEKPEGWN